MKISWGTGILITIILFMVASISMAVFFMSQEVHLVTDNYYEKELEYQKQIDIEKQTKELDENIEIKFNGAAVTILLPELYSDKKINGEIYFYRPSDPHKDFKLPLQLSEKKQIVPVKGFTKGFWRIKLLWEMDGEKYYFERAITIN
jgi:hypothetical protein